MATIYVWSGATGANNGTSWTDAYTTLQAALTAWTTADVIYMHCGATTPHYEGFSASVTFTCANASQTNPCPVFGVDKDNSDAPITTPATTPNLETHTSNFDIGINFSCIFNGLSLTSTRSINTGNLTGATFVGNFCRFKYVTGASSNNYFVSLADPLAGGLATYNQCIFTNPQGRAILFKDGLHILKQCTFNDAGLAAGFFRLFPNQSCEVWFIGCDFSAITVGQVLFELPNEVDNARARLVQCKLSTSYTLTSSTWTAGTRIELYNSDSGSSHYRTELHGFWGTCVTSSGVYLDGGFSDKTGSDTATPLSHKLTPRNTQCKFFSPLLGLPLIARVGSAGSKTFTIEAIENFTAALQNNEAWIEVHYLGTSLSTQWHQASTKVFSGDTPANLAAGVGLTSWQQGISAPPAGSRSVKLAKTLTVNQIGYYQVQVFLGKYEAGKVLHYDPLPVVT